MNALLFEPKGIVIVQVAKDLWAPNFLQVAGRLKSYSTAKRSHYKWKRKMFHIRTKN